MSTQFIKDAHADLDFVFDWSDWLASSETIASQVITVDTGLTEGTGAKATSQSAGKVTVWLSGGTAGTTYNVACKITTSDSRIDERTIKIRVLQR
jgi:hypothetical protein